jgi:hypothetical protein
MGAFALSSMRIAAYVAGQYSMRRKVIDSSTGKSQAIIAFITQKIPVLTAISQTIVMTAFCAKAHNLFTSTEDLLQKHFIAAVFKTTIVQHAISLLSVLGDRCGAQGLFAANQIPVIHVSATTPLSLLLFNCPSGKPSGRGNCGRRCARNINS